jgi:hypothetical protein
LRLLAEEEARRRASELAAAEKAAAEAEMRRMFEEEMETMRLRKEMEEAEERHRRLVAKGQHKYLLKGQGHKAADEAGKIHQEKLAEKAAKEDIAKFSLSHAKKEGLLTPAAVSAPISEPTLVAEEEAADGTKVPATATKKVELVEITGDLAKNWDADWTAEEELKFSQLRADK